MRVGVMVTNGGPHPPEKWAVMTAGQIVQIESSATGQIASDGRKMELRLIDILEDAHRKVQDSERIKLANSPEHVATKLDPRAHVERPLDQIIYASKGTLLAGHFAKPEVHINLRNLLAQHFGNVMHIERLWYADRMPNDPHAVAYRKRTQEGRAA